ncbi:MAG: ABC transporter permease [Armatimonadota bacterium]|nr:ABC transporter permease [Armatimonadota bacterium]MDR7484748.1 ABC transporter permease [Armatimonadota bacterium]MDR7531863.1 ABC transporter permease [Armatimonadota bacterium]MDR7534792.1 ABC transporter permease [Armatimonadota bacterium]
MREDLTVAPLAPARLEPARRSEWHRGWRRFTRYRPGVAGLGFLLILLVLAAAPDVFAPYPYQEVFRGMRGAPPSWSHPLGFDHIGRDVLSRIIHGTRVALIVGLLATGIAVAIGVAVGATAGYLGGAVDAVLSRLVDTLMAYPLLVLLITLAAVLGPSLVTVVVIIGLTTWAQYARVVRAEVLSLREREFVLAAQAAGAGVGRIILRHIVPNVLSPVVVIASLGIGGIILLESALSFLGLGAQPPTPSWGGMLADGRAFILTYPQIAIAPGVMISLTVLAFNLVGDGLRDALDPRQKDIQLPR